MSNLSSGEPEGGASERGRFWWLGAIVGIAVLLRFVGLNFGFPYLFHPDEPTAVKRALFFFSGDFNPRWFSMPSLYLYLLHFTYRLYSLLGASAPFRADQPSLYLIGRIWSAVLGSATVPAVYLAGRELYGRKAALGAALALAVLPLHVLHSHYATVDVPVTFCIAVSFYFSARILKSGSFGSYLGAGWFAGLAASLKYNGSFAVLPMLAAHGLSLRSRTGCRRSWFYLVMGLLLLAAVFFASSPFIIKEHGRFFSDLRSQSNYLIRYGHGPIFIATRPGALYHLRSSLYYAGGTVFWLLSVGGIVLAGFRHEKSDLLIASWVIPYFILISMPTVKFVRFFIPLLPFLCLWSGRLLTLRLPRPWQKRCLAGAYLAGCFWMLLYAAGFARILAGTDARVVAKEWIEETIAPGKRIGMIRTETGLVFLDDPPLTVPHPRFKIERYPRLLPALEAGPDYLIVTDFDNRDILRLKERYDIIRYNLWVKFLDGRAGYRKVAEFFRPPAIFGLAFGGIFPPHDMTYNCPRIEVFEKAQVAGAP